MQTPPSRSYWIAAGMERPARIRILRSPGEMLHRIGSVVLALAWSWMFIAAIVTVARLDALELSPWGSVEAAAWIVGPGVAGIVAAMVIEVLARRRR